MKLSKELLIDICNEIGYLQAKNLRGITLDLLCEAACTEFSIVPYIQSVVDCSKQTVTNFIAKTIPDRDPIKDRSISKFLLAKRNLKHCTSCTEVLPTSEFNKNKSKPDGTNDFCRVCANDARIESYNKDPQREILANQLRKADITMQTPKWVNMQKISEIYKNRPEGCHVDHIIPLHGKLVSGLNVENNLQYLSAEDNIAKGNRFEVT